MNDYKVIIILIAAKEAKQDTECTGQCNIGFDVDF